MSVAVVFGGIALVVFGLVLLSGRRLGPLVLALAAGAMLAEFWASWLAVFIGGLGIAIPGVPSGVLASLIITILPLCLLLFGGPRYSKKREKIIAALVVALVTAALLVKPLGQFLVPDATGLAVYKVLHEWWRVVATAGLVAGLADMFLLHTVKLSDAKKKH